MPKRKSGGLKVTFNAPVSLVFAFLSVAFFALDYFAFKGKFVAGFLTCPGNASCSTPFNFSNFLDYLKLFLHVLGNVSWNNLFISLAFILLIGPVLEERYGSPIVLLAIIVVSFLTGVLNIVCCSTTMTGAAPVVYMMILLAVVVDLDKKRLPLTFLFVLILWTAFQMMNCCPKPQGFIHFMKSNISTFINLAGGICGSLFGFLVAPKKSRTNKKDIHTDTTISYEDSAVKKPGLFSKINSKKSSSTSDETVIGEIKL